MSEPVVWGISAHLSTGTLMFALISNNVSVSHAWWRSNKPKCCYLLKHIYVILLYGFSKKRKKGISAHLSTGMCIGGMCNQNNEKAPAHCLTFRSLSKCKWARQCVEAFFFSFLVVVLWNKVKQPTKQHRSMSERKESGLAASLGLYMGCTRSRCVPSCWSVCQTS